MMNKFDDALKYLEVHPKNIFIISLISTLQILRRLELFKIFIGELKYFRP